MSFLPTQNTITVGGQTFINPTTSLKMLVGVVNSSGTTNKTTARVMGGSAGYAVPALKSYRLLALSMSFQAADIFAVGYADNDMGVAGNTAPTNPVWLLANPGGSGDGYFSAMPTVSGTLIQVGLGAGFVVPTGKYLFIVGGGLSNGGCLFYGVEE